MLLLTVLCAVAFSTTLQQPSQAEQANQPRIQSSNSVAIDPIFLDLDDFSQFNDISSADIATVPTLKKPISNDINIATASNPSSRTISTPRSHGTSEISTTRASTTLSTTRKTSTKGLNTTPTTTTTTRATSAKTTSVAQTTPTTKTTPTTTTTTTPRTTHSTTTRRITPPPPTTTTKTTTTTTSTTTRPATTTTTTERTTPPQYTTPVTISTTRSTTANPPEMQPIANAIDLTPKLSQAKMYTIDFQNDVNIVNINNPNVAAVSSTRFVDELTAAFPDGISTQPLPFYSRQGVNNQRNFANRYYYERTVTPKPTKSFPTLIPIIAETQPTTSPTTTTPSTTTTIPSTTTYITTTEATTKTERPSTRSSVQSWQNTNTYPPGNHWATTSSPDPEGNEIWWTPAPAFIGPMQPVTYSYNKDESLQELEPAQDIPADWVSVTTELPAYVKPKIKQAAEQKVINELELLASSMNMKELVRDLRGEGKSLDSVDEDEVEQALQAKRRTLAQLERLHALAESSRGLEMLIEKQEAILRQRERVRASRTLRVDQWSDSADAEYSSSTSAESSTVPRARPPPPAVKRWVPPEVEVPPPPPTDLQVRSIFSLSQLLDVDHKELDPLSKITFCQQLTCNFENGTLCGLETSFDERTRRTKRQSEDLPVIRSWSNWIGRYSARAIRIDKAPEFKTTKNRRFAGVLLEPNEIASLRIKVTTRSPFMVRYRGWAATPGVRLRVCCDVSCAKGISGQYQWRKLTAQCPENTRTLWFECENTDSGGRRGACGLDDVFVQANGCPKLFTGNDN